MKVSVVINTFNRLHTLPNAMAAIQRQRYPDVELIVVDGPSTDGTYGYLLAKWKDKVKILQCPEANLSMSRNIGILAADGDIVAFTDDDGIPEPDWLDRIVEGYSSERIGAVGGFVRNHTGVDYQTKYNVSDRHGFTKEHIESADAIPEYGPGSFEFPRLIGVNSTFRTSVLKEVGGFDEEYAYFYDEVDLAIRIVDAGYEIVTIPEAEVHHKYAESHIRTEKGVPRSWRVIARSTAYFCIKNRPKEDRFVDSLTTIDRHHHIFHNQSHWAQSHGGLSNAEFDGLLKSLADGIKDGVRDAFAYPQRRLMAPNGPEHGDFLALPKLTPSERKYRLAFVTDLYPPRPCGGIAVFMNQLAIHLAAQGHEITVITFADGDNPHTVDFEDGVWVHRLQFDQKNLANVKVPHMSPGMQAVARKVLGEIERVKEHRPIDWVIGTIWDLHIAAAIASKNYRVAMYLVTSHGLMLDSKPEWKADKKYFEEHVAKMLLAERWALDEVDLILASTNAIKKDMEATYGRELPPSRTEIQPFGIAPPRKMARTKRVGSARGVEILFVGRFEARKGIEELLDVISTLLKKGENLQFTLIGDNSIKGSSGTPYWEDFCTKHVGADWLDRIDLRGVVSDEDLEQAYADCDIFVAPSRYESFGLIYVEAMRHSKPCIGCSIGGIPEVVIDGETGVLVPSNDKVSLAMAIERLARSPEERKSMGEAGLRRYHEKFTIDAFGAGFIAKLAAADRSLDKK